MEYLERIIDKKIDIKLKSAGAVVIRGPKWCGKTTSAKKFVNSCIELQDSQSGKNYLNVAKENPSYILEGDKPRLIDEWQLAPNLWNAIRNDIDVQNAKGLYVLTCSSVPPRDDSMHSGVGRFAIVNMKPLSLYESGDSNGKISLKDLFDGKRDINGITTDIQLKDIAYLICRGGWPSSISESKEVSLEIAYNYVDVLVESDISRIDGVRRNPEVARVILKAYARAVCTISSNSSIIKDVMANFSDISQRSIVDYLSVLKNLYIIDEIEAWSPNIRSKTTIRSSNKKSFVDPSLAVASLGVNENDILMDPNTFGLLFENLVNRDLSIYADSFRANIKHYRDRYGLECDNIIHCYNGKYALVETKLSEVYLEDAVANLIELRDLIVSKQPILGEPEFLMVITGGNMSYTTKEGVLVVPITCLKD